MTAAVEDRLDATFGALANATRRAMLARLARGEATVNELAEPFRLSLPAISKHLKVLERAGLIVRGQQAQYRPRTQLMERSVHGTRPHPGQRFLPPSARDLGVHAVAGGVPVS
jgi:DNA-binding transcriptional ArsR family regulator